MHTNERFSTRRAKWKSLSKQKGWQEERIKELEIRRQNKWEESRQEKVKYLGQQFQAMQMIISYKQGNILLSFIMSILV